MGNCMQAEDSEENNDRFNSHQNAARCLRDVSAEAKEKAAARAEARRVRDSPAIQVNVILKDGSPDGAFSDLAVNVKQLVNN